MNHFSRAKKKQPPEIERLPENFSPENFYELEELLLDAVPLS